MEQHFSARSITIDAISVNGPDSSFEQMELDADWFRSIGQLTYIMSPNKKAVIYRLDDHWGIEGTGIRFYTSSTDPNRLLITNTSMDDIESFFGVPTCINYH